ncbi:Na+/proline symporter [Roseinatronobacter thiooxidans]|uniref:histidine kinase n=1 Tax=Roseinatronobacter thiooxidans TaxID=121821 RepID=A0A2W7S846_9RHOB|nr:ATP-binding protein [Roseinatronobacter thiooxidans]PZX46742.1 Na+/proline symporter [Roseinatronobacter thiooxidans]
MSFNLLVLTCLGYVILLFAVASAAERSAAEGRAGWLRSPMVYTLSLSVYCTAWTFYGAVGYAARSGLEFMTIYLGPTLVFVGWWVILRKLVRIGRENRVTSIADMISARYGKSNLLGVIVTLLCVSAGTPYIALQLQSISQSFTVFATDPAGAGLATDRNLIAFWVAGGLALFTIAFGTRNLDANEQHPGVVTAIAVEAVVKLLALIAVGIFAVWFVASGPADILARIDAQALPEWQIQPGRWTGLILLSAIAIICLPRMFQVMVVENTNDQHLATASWAFPLYLFLISLFVLPIAVVGLEVMPPGTNPDMFVLTLPLHFGQDGLALLSFLGGFSAATSMVIVASLALATMVSNHIVVPLWLKLRSAQNLDTGDMRLLVLSVRRLSITLVLGLGYIYYIITGGSAALAAIGLIAFVGVAQILPALLGALFWRGASRTGAALGLVVGTVLWFYTLFLPSFGPDIFLSAQVMEQGLMGLAWLRPYSLFGLSTLDPLLHALFWSLALNALAFCLGSFLSFPSPIERVQGALFVNIFDRPGPARSWTRPVAEAEDLLPMAQRILGATEGQAFFRAQAEVQGKQGFLPDITPEFLEALELKLSGSVGAATAHAMLAQSVGTAVVSVEDLMAVASETAQIMEYSAQLEAKSKELSRTARKLREANEMLQKLSVQKDAFLSQISHELRTPMTSIRAFSEILMDDEGMSTEDRNHFAQIIHDESIRLTRLLDDLLDLSVLEHGQVQLNIAPVNLRELIDKAMSASNSVQADRKFRILRSRDPEAIEVITDAGRLTQVFINILSNARKYCDAPEPQMQIEVRQNKAMVEVDFIDNGSGIPRDKQALIFEKFSRLTDSMQAGGAGLGLAICREIMHNLGGEITYVPGQGGAAFRVSFPLELKPRTQPDTLSGKPVAAQ